VQADFSGFGAVPRLRSRIRWSVSCAACSGVCHHYMPSLPLHIRHVLDSMLAIRQQQACVLDQLSCLQAPLTFYRENLTTTLPAQDSGTVTFDNCSFSCPTTTESSPSYQIVSRVWTPLELLSSVNLADSRMLLLQQSIATANNSWGSTPVLIAESM